MTQWRIVIEDWEYHHPPRCAWDDPEMVEKLAQWLIGRFGVRPDIHPGVARQDAVIIMRDVIEGREP